MIICHHVHRLYIIFFFSGKDCPSSLNENAECAGANTACVNEKGKLKCRCVDGYKSSEGHCKLEGTLWQRKVEWIRRLPSHRVAASSTLGIEEGNPFRDCIDSLLIDLKG